MPTKKSLIHSSRWFLFTVEVHGESAWPALVPDRRYLATSLLKPKVGDFVIFRNPKDASQVLIKKVREIMDGNLFVEGLVSWASSSDDFGTIRARDVAGKLLFV